MNNVINPFIFILKLPFRFIKLVCIGIYFLFYIVISFALDIIKYAILGFIYISYGVYSSFCSIFKIVHYDFSGFLVIAYFIYKFFKYVLYGLVFPFILILNMFIYVNKTITDYFQNKTSINERRKLAKKQAYERSLAEKRRREAEMKRRREEALLAKRKKKSKDEYHNENVKFQKKSFGEKINDFLVSLTKIPISIKKYFISKYNNLDFVKNAKNKKDINRQALLIDFEGDDAVKSEKKVLYEYVGKNEDGKVVKGYFAAFSRVEVHSFLLSEGFEVYSIRTNKWIELLHGESTIGKTRIKTKDLIFFTTQLSTYVKAGIPLVEALKILTRQYKKKSYQNIFRTMVYDLTMGENFSNAMAKQGEAFPRLLINMVKASEMTGELPEALDDMANYFTESDKTRKQMITAMMYPTMVFIIAMCVIVFILVWVIPKFVDIYKSMDASQIPAFTLMVIGVSNFLKTKGIFLAIGIVMFILLNVYLYKNVKIFRSSMQWFMMHLPIFGTVIIYNEVTMFTKTFSSLLKHNVFITDSMEILNKITNNEIYKMLILDTINNLAKGEKISTAFKNHWAFPVPAYEMLVTGEKTGELPEMMAKVSEYYQDMHAQSVARIKTFVEPALLIFLTAVVGVIILSVVIPMFGMYSAIQ